MMICSQHTQKVSFVLFCFFYRLITNCCIFFLSRKIKLINSPLIFFTTSLLVLLRCDDKFSLFFFVCFSLFQMLPNILQVFFRFLYSGQHNFQTWFNQFCSVYIHFCLFIVYCVCVWVCVKIEFRFDFFSLEKKKPNFIIKFGSLSLSFFPSIFIVVTKSLQQQ